jgi:hypothetical protein
MFKMPGITQETLDMLKQAKPQDLALLQKAFNQSLGLVWYDLEPTAKLLYPVITPLRNMIPRVSGAGGTAVNWKQITAVNANKQSAGVSEGNRTARITTTANNKNATYKGLGLEDSVSFEADYAGMNFDDIKALAVLGLLRAMMMEEEKVILYGNPDFQINGGNAAPTPTATLAGNGSLTANTVYHCKYIPLTPESYAISSVAGNVMQVANRTNADGTNDTYNLGTGVPSAANNANTGASNNAITFAVPAANIAAGTLKGAAAYAWFCGTNGANANVTLTAITTVPKFTYTGNETQGNQKGSDLNANDCSNDSLLFAGLWNHIVSANSNAYFKDLGGNNLTGVNGTMEIDEIEVALKAFWDNYKLSPDYMIMSAQELKNINRKTEAGNGLPVVRFNLDAGTGVQNYSAGAVVGSYINKYTMSGGSLVKFLLHPNMPPGSLMFYSSQIPYPLSNVSNILQMKLRRDYYQIEWPLRTRAYEYGVYMDGLLQNFFPPAFGLITGINDG